MTIRRIKMRRDTTSNWQTENPALHQGEIGFEITAGSLPNKFKIGDGFNAWNDLDYADESTLQDIRNEYGDETSFELHFDLNK